MTDNTTPKFLNSVTEHPDVQRLIIQLETLSQNHKALQVEHKQLKEERSHTKHWVNYHNVSVKNEELKAENKELKDAIIDSSPHKEAVSEKNKLLEINEKLQAENAKLKKGIEDTCELIRDKGIVSKWKILNWLEKVLKG